MTETAVVPQTHRSEPTTYWLGLAGLIVLVLACYWPSMRGAFIWDDDFYVTNNLALKTSEGIEQIWLHNPRGGVLPAHDYPVPQFYPMTITSFWAQTARPGLDCAAATWPFHLINVLLHIASAWLLWTILRRLQVPGAFVAAAIWALHPVQVESVAWITERKNVLSGFFYFASMLIYLRFAGLDAPALRRGARHVFLAGREIQALCGRIVLFIFAILSKSVTGSLPAVILLLIWWKRGKITESDVWPLVPFFVLAIAMGATTSYFERNVVGRRDRTGRSPPASESSSPAGRSGFMSSSSSVRSIWRLSIRNGICIRRCWWRVASGIVVIASSRRFTGDRPGAAGDRVLFAGTLFPALGFINVFPMPYSFVADHFQYLAGSAVIAGGVCCLHRFFSTPTRFAVASGLILGPWAMTWAQNHLYTSPAILWADTLQKNPNSLIAHNNLGVIELGNDKLDDAEKQFNEALELKPEYVEAMMNLGLIQQKRGDLPGAIDWMIRDHRGAKRSDPRSGRSAGLFSTWLASSGAGRQTRRNAGVPGQLQRQSSLPPLCLTESARCITKWGKPKGQTETPKSDRARSTVSPCSRQSGKRVAG